MSAIIVVIAMFFGVNFAKAGPSGAAQVAAQYKFKQLPIAVPPGYHPTQNIRPVNPAYQHIRSWISSVGAGIALTDVTGHGRDDGMCIVDPRTDEVVVTYAPTAPAADRFTPFALNAAPLPMNSTMAPMGCAPGDFNQDGRTDFLVYYWGRTPIVFLARSTATSPSPSAYQPAELVPELAQFGQYAGPQWNTNAVSIASFAGTGHPDIFVGNYFPISDVLNPRGVDNVQMNSSMSDAKNGGGDYVFRWMGGTSGPHPTVRYKLEQEAVPYQYSTGWTLAAASADLTGNGLPDLYIANDFGPDHLLYNVSTPGYIKFSNAIGERTPMTPKSFQLGKDSFKGMGVTFGDLADNGRFDMMVSNITTAWGLEESNFVWMNTAANDAAAKKDLASGLAPFAQKADQEGMAWTGWGWDLKMGDFTNSGNMAVVQADGFIKGKLDRWPWLQEMAMTNDQVYTNPASWPLVEPGDDIAGHQCIAFYAKAPAGGYVNISKRLGLCAPTPTRGIATADTRADGRLDFAVARQWGPPAFYANQARHRGAYLGLQLFRPVAGGSGGQGLQNIGSPAYGATAQIDLPDGHTQIAQLDGGSGHSGKSSMEIYFGLGSYHGPVTVHLRWSTPSGLHQQTLQLMPGTHDLFLTSTVKEVPSR
ncbi:MAG TPA: ASPIC/UnbV domain-containing protein [Streptosporangiaceae bacterium]